MATNYPARLDTLLSDLKTYRQTLQSKLAIESGGLNPNSKVAISKTSGNDGEFLKMVDINIVLVAFGLPTPICWPYAIAGGFTEQTVDLRFMESHGSLWRILRRPDPNPGTRVILQTNEIGERPMYLSSELTLVEFQESAAVWSVYSNKKSISNAPGDYKGTDPQARQASIIAKFELFESVQSSLKSSDSKCLASVVTTTGQVAIALISENEASEHQQQGKEDDFAFSFMWEIVPENSDASNAPDFFSDAY